MQRLIKFRAWDKNSPNKDGGEWVYSQPMPDMGFWKWVSYDSDTIFCEYTGLKDKNGKEIYEGDIVKGDVVTLVEWSADVCGEYNCIGWGGLQNGYGGLPTGQDIEVIGNIYENKDLLNENN